MQGANVYLASAELAAVASTIGRLPTADEYLAQWKKIDANAADTYKYLNFDQARLDTHIPGVFERY